MTDKEKEFVEKVKAESFEESHYGMLCKIICDLHEDLTDHLARNAFLEDTFKNQKEFIEKGIDRELENGRLRKELQAARDVLKDIAEAKHIAPHRIAYSALKRIDEFLDIDQ